MRIAKESVLREQLWILRDSIRQFQERHHEHPMSLSDLVREGCIRMVPVDPLTDSSETWITEDADDGRGIVDVRSGAEGETIEGVPYSDL